MTTDMTRLGVLPPDIEPRATENIDQVNRRDQAVESRSLAYASTRRLLRPVAEFPGYGQLSGQASTTLRGRRTHTRIFIDESKRSPLDFALWKGPSRASRLGKPVGDRRRPGWHTRMFGRWPIDSWEKSGSRSAWWRNGPHLPAPRTRSPSRRAPSAWDVRPTLAALPEWSPSAREDVQVSGNVVTIRHVARDPRPRALGLGWRRALRSPVSFETRPPRRGGRSRYPTWTRPRCGWSTLYRTLERN